MISKEYRLTEREVKKVLNRKKPFFSYTCVANTLDIKNKHGRCGILLSSKCTKGSVNRNFWRRKFYDISLPFLDATPLDIVLVMKKGTVLNYKNEGDILEFEKNLQFIYKKIKETKN
ncbi:hypothetical protein HOO68_00985 [Candidatus Gracilibacteria bacterium]|nr:hypothetical protein [Candidatus Gracilibacteria bacterium]